VFDVVGVAKRPEPFSTLIVDIVSDMLEVRALGRYLTSVGVPLLFIAILCKVEAAVLVVARIASAI
jgi:hypothetical protein